MERFEQTKTITGGTRIAYCGTPTGTRATYCSTPRGKQTAYCGIPTGTSAYLEMYHHWELVYMLLSGDINLVFKKYIYIFLENEVDVTAEEHVY